MEKLAADGASKESSDAEGEECEAHVGALLARRGEARNVIVIPRLLRKFAKRDHGKSDVGSDDRRMDGEDRKCDHSDERAEDYGAEGGDFLSEDAHSDGQRNDDKRAGGEHLLRVGRGINVVVNVERKSDEFLPVDDPVSRENQEEEHELGIGDDFDKIAQSFAQMRGLFFVGSSGLLEEEKDGKKHHEDAGGSRAEDIFNAEVLVDVGSDERANET